MRPHPLLVIGLIFAASFSGRAITFASAASKSASEASSGAAEKPVKHAATASGQADAETVETDSAAAQSSFIGEDAGGLLGAIRERSATLDQREAAIAEREQILSVVERRVEEKTAEMRKLKEELESRLAFAETAAQGDIAHLAKMYEAMKPAKAGEIFNAMDPKFAAGFLTEMNSDSAALILANMETEKAYAASIIIAGRNASISQR